MINVPAEVWIDEARIDRGGGRRRSISDTVTNGELSSADGMVELLVPIDIGALGKTITVRFPASALLRLHHLSD